MPYSEAQIRVQRDQKVREVLKDLAPIWLVKEEYKSYEDSVIFHLVFQDSSYGWMNHRYKFDVFNGVLYHLGWRLLSEAETLEIQAQEPYLDGEVADHVPNAPGFRTGSGFVPR